MILKRWYLSFVDNKVFAWGEVFENPKFASGAFIHTNFFEYVKVDDENKQLVFHTKSGSDYIAAYEDIQVDINTDVNVDIMKNLKASWGYLNISPAILDEALALANKKIEFIKETLNKDLENGDLYIEIQGGRLANLHFKYKDIVHKLDCGVHVGMFNDSYLYTIPGIVDFRHYEYGFNTVTTYSISDSIKRLVVDNQGEEMFRIDGIEYPSGKTITCVTEENHVEGLFSPDMFNGKSALFTPNEEEEN